MWRNLTHLKIRSTSPLQVLDYSVGEEPVDQDWRAACLESSLDRHAFLRREAEHDLELMDPTEALEWR